jgi:hypothetical protein
VHNSSSASGEVAPESVDIGGSPGGVGEVAHRGWPAMPEREMTTPGKVRQDGHLDSAIFEMLLE